MMNRRLCAVILAGSLLTSPVALAAPPSSEPLPEPVVPISAPAQAFTTATVTIGDANAVINGRAVQLPFQPYLKQDRTMVPLDVLAQFLNTTPTYSPQDDSVTIHPQGKAKVTFRVGEAEVRVGEGAARELPVAVELVDDLSSVPLRALAELFDVQVHYDNGVITLIRKAHQDYRIGFLALEGKLLPVFDYSKAPNVYVGYAKDYLTDYPEGEGEAMILAISQPGQEMMIQSIEVKEDRVVVHVIPESRWSNAPEGTMGPIHYGPRRVVKLLDPLPEGVRLEIDGYELPVERVREAREVTFAPFDGRLELTNAQIKEARAFGQVITIDDKEQFVLVAALGERHTGGYAIQVVWIEEAEGKLIVHAQETTPAPGSHVIQAITYPYEVVVVDGSYKDWDMELNLMQSVDFTQVDWIPLSSYEFKEKGIVKSTGEDGTLLLTACAGAKPNPGYGLTIERVEQKNNKLLIVHARVTEPAPGTIWAQVISYPQDIVAVSGAYGDYAVQLVLH